MPAIVVGWKEEEGEIGTEFRGKARLHCPALAVALLGRLDNMEGRSEEGGRLGRARQGRCWRRRREEEALALAGGVAW